METVVKIDSEFRSSIPSLSAEELAQLEANIVADGCRDPLVVWQGTLLDGHNRYAICTRLGLPFSVVEVDLPDREAAFDWIDANALGRRNLTRDQWDLLLGRRYNRQKKAVGGRADRNLSGDQIEHPKTADILAAEYGVSPATVRRDGQFAEAVETLTPFVPDLPERIRQGDRMPRQTVIEAAKEPETAAQKLAHVGRNSGNNEWYTPAEYIEAARSVLGEIDLDPASSELANTVVKATTFYDSEQDGLEQDWAGRVFMNPPYAGKWIGKFCDKLAESVESKAVSEAIVLVNNGTETNWFQKLLARAAAVCFPSGRVKFVHPSGELGKPLQGQAVLYFGQNVAAYSEAFRTFGQVLRK